MAIAKQGTTDSFDEFGLEILDANLEALFSAVDALQEDVEPLAPLVDLVPAGYRIDAGAQALDGSNPTTITTRLTTIVAVVLTLKGTAAPGLGACVLTWNASGGIISVYAWKPTSAANPTLIAATDTDTFGWFAIGT